MRWLNRLIAAAALTASLAVSVCSPALAQSANSKQQPLAQSVKVPALLGRVSDHAEVLTPEQEAGLTQKLASIETRTTNHDQVVILTVKDMGENDVETYANTVARSWRVGQDGKNNGLLIMIALKERKIRFEVGGGLEGVMTDAQSFLIERKQMVPLLTKGHEDYSAALNVAVDSTGKLLMGESTGDRAIDTGEDSSIRHANPKLHLPPNVLMVLVIGGIVTFVLGLLNGFISPFTGAATGAGAAYIGGSLALGSLLVSGGVGLLVGAFIGFIAYGIRTGAISPFDIPFILTGGGGGGGGGFNTGGGGDFGGGGSSDSF